MPSVIYITSVYQCQQKKHKLLKKLLISAKKWFDDQDGKVVGGVDGKDFKTLNIKCDICEQHFTINKEPYNFEINNIQKREVSNILLADPGEARGCSTNTFVIN